MEKFILNITASSGEFYQGYCESLTLPTGDGVYGVQAGHNPVLVALHMGIAKFTVDGETREVLVGDGIAEVTPTFVLLLVDSAERPEDIDRNRAEAARIRAEERLQHKQSMHEYYQSKIALDRAMQRLVTQEIALLLTRRLLFHIIVCRQEKTSGTAGWVTNRFPNLWGYAIYHCFDEWAWSKVLTGTTFLVLPILFKDTFVDSTFHVSIHDQPLLFINHGNDFFQIDWLVNLVLCFCINCTDKIFLFTQQFQGIFILPYQIQTVKRY